MYIKIAERLKPYSHEPGAFCILPGTVFRCTLFPAFIRIDNLLNLHSPLLKEIKLNISGPVKDFTVLQNLEHGTIQVWGYSSTGYFRYSIYSEFKNLASHIVLKLEKAPIEGLIINSLMYKAGETLEILKIEKETQLQSVPFEIPERLSLGLHKSQDWCLIKPRKNLGEIFPIWLRLGSCIPYFSSSLNDLEGTASLLDECHRYIMKEDRLNVLNGFMNLFLAGFEGMLSPRLIDTQHQGFLVPKLSDTSELSPLILLTEGAKLIRSLFIQVRDFTLGILPVLPVEFHCGRLINVHCENIGIIDLEWSKKQIRRMIFRSQNEGDLLFSFKHVKSYRLKTHKKDRGNRIDCSEKLTVEKNKVYFFDNFMH